MIIHLDDPFFHAFLMLVGLITTVALLAAGPIALIYFGWMKTGAALAVAIVSFVTASVRYE